MKISGPPSRYAAAVVLPAIALVLRVATSSFFGSDVAFITFYPAVMFVATLGGLGPGLVATAVSAVSAARWILPHAPHLPMDAPATVGLAVFAFMGTAISVTAGLHRRSRRGLAEREKDRVLRESEERSRKREADALHESEERLRLAVESAELGTWDFDPVTGASRCSERCRAVLGLPPDARFDYQGFLDRLHPDDRQRVHEVVQQALDPAGGGRYDTEYRAHRPDGTERWIGASGRAVLGTVDGRRRAVRLVSTVLDITGRKRAKQEREVTVDFLRLVNRTSGTSEMVKAAATFFQQQSACEALGIRLRDGDDYPYYEARGFSKEFILLENRLCRRDGAGEVVRDSAGDPVIECMCGNVICGRVDPGKPFFSSGGSFWANDTTRLLATTTDADRQAPTRNRCNGEGYESVALIPLLAGEERLGLLQLNDRRRGMFSPETVALWERLAGYLAVALATSRAVEQLAAEKERDRTRERRAEQVLRESEERFRSLFETMSEGFSLTEVICDDRGKPCDLRYLKVNPAFERHTGLKAADIVGKTILQLFPGTEPEWFERYGKVALTGVPAHFEAPFGPLGKWFEVSAYRTEPGRFAAVFFDITERKQAEAERERLLAEVEHQRALLDAVVEYLPVGIGIARAPSGELVRINAETRRIWRMEAMQSEDVESYGKYVAFHPDGRQYSSEDWQLVRALRGEVIRGEEVEFIRGDGSRGVMRSSAGPVKDARGDIVAAIVVIDDVTREKEAEVALRESELRARAILDSLTESDRRKSEFIAVLSHELRNPLAPIQSSLYLLDHAPPGSDTAARAREIIRRQTGHLTRLVDDLLDVTRISRGKFDLRRTRIDAREVVRRACDDRQAAFHDRGLELRVEASAPVWIDADETRLAQVVGNLLQNAAKFSDEGGVVIAGVGRSEGQAEIRVRDDGAGVAPELLPRIFEPFVQADGGLARTNGGLGLGLALVKGLAELHGGSVHAYSEGAGRGSEFVVSLPLASAPERPEPGPAPSAPSGSVEILVIEDNLDAAQSIADVLEIEGHRVRVATGGRSGIAMARELQPEVILCDIGLPDVDGYQIARALRADDSLRSTRLIALSGYAQPEDIERAKEAGFDAHLRKPASPDALLASVARRGEG